jgi:hypothetical protein
MINKTKNILLIFYLCFSFSSSAQSFNEDKTSIINYVKRMFISSPFEGAKLIEGNESNYFVAAITLSNNINSTEINTAIAEKKAQDAAMITFAEPCVKFEMLSSIADEIKKTITYLFSCQPLSEFIKSAYKKQSFEGARIISTPKNNYFVTVIALDSQKYPSEALMDRVSLIKAKQQANTLFNGSVISSDIIIKTDDTSVNSSSIEIIREQSMGFVEGLETLAKYPLNEKKVYIYYRKLINK